MQIYVDLFYNNIEHFLSSAFPVSKRILHAGWPQLVREFVHRHGSESPYFLQISEEFMTFLDHRGLEGLPPFLLELCHYEWVELSLDVAPDPEPVAVSATWSTRSVLRVSSLARMLTYAFPVHLIGVSHQPQTPPASPTLLIVYRTLEQRVRFIESNAMTHRLLELVRLESVADSFATLVEELSTNGVSVDYDKVETQGLQTLRRLQRQGIVLGAEIDD